MEQRDCKNMSFNPRTRESATYDYYPDAQEIHVSIHALVRVRRAQRATSTYLLRFNPRTRESATIGEIIIPPYFGVSIHALVRVRPGIQCAQGCGGGFNPRTRESATLPKMGTKKST